MTAVIAPVEPVAIASEDAELVMHAQAGSRAAMTRLHQRYAPMVHAILLAHGTQPDADDLTQDVFVQALSRIATLRRPGAFGGWLASIARNAARDHQRRRKPRVALAENTIAQPARAPARVEANRVLGKLAALPDTQRELLTMRLVEGMSGPEIADRTGQTHGSVRVALHRGMAALRKALQSEVEA
jgi:RNA polymerase sigma-70 factor, ECF subfamily